MALTEQLKISTSRKVAPLADPVKGAKVKNCFSLPAGRANSCPGATDACDPDAGGYCYAGRDERRFPSVRALVDRNLAMLREAGTVDGMAELLADVVARFVVESDRRGTVKVFRIHEDGDFFSADYARAWAKVVKSFPDVQFWCYTRSFVDGANFVHILKGIENLALYVSVDENNQTVARRRAATWARWGVRTAIVGQAETVQETSVALIGRKSPVCPEIAGKVPLVNAEGVGACVTCGLCIFDRAPVIFPIHR